jgi:hypothetical protein
LKATTVAIVLLMILRLSSEYVSLLRRGWVRVLLLVVWWCGGGCLRHRDGGWSRRWRWADANRTDRVDGCLDLLAAMNTSKLARNPFFTFVVVTDIVVGGRSSIWVDLVELHGEWQVDFADDFLEILFARLVEGPQLVVDCCFQAREVNILFEHLWVVVMGYQSKEPGSCTTFRPRNLLKESELVSDGCVGGLGQYVNLEIKRPCAPLWQIGLKHDPAIFVRNEVS